MLHDCPFLHWVSLRKEFSSTSQFDFLFTRKRIWDLGIPGDALSAACQGQNAVLTFTATEKEDRSYQYTSCSTKCFHFNWKVNTQANKRWKKMSFTVFGLQCWSILNHPWFSVANRSNFVIFLIPLLCGQKSKDRLVFSSLTNCFLDKLKYYLNCSPSGPLAFALGTWKRIELILSTVRISLAWSKYFLSYIIHINYCTFDLCNLCAWNGLFVSLTSL